MAWREHWMNHDRIYREGDLSSLAINDMLQTYCKQNDGDNHRQNKHETRCSFPCLSLIFRCGTQFSHSCSCIRFYRRNVQLDIVWDAARVSDVHHRERKWFQNRTYHAALLINQCTEIVEYFWQLMNATLDFSNFCFPLLNQGLLISQLMRGKPFLQNLSLSLFL